MRDLRLAARDVAVEPMPLSEANALCVREHYLHRARPAGFGIRVLYRGAPSGVFIFAWPMVAGVCCGFPPKQIVELARMWLSDNVPNLATCAFYKALRLVRARWPQVKAIVSWCDRTRFDGGFYRAANFKFHGVARLRSLEKSATRFGGGRPNRAVHADRLNRKDRYLLVLSAKSRRKG